MALVLKLIYQNLVRFDDENKDVRSENFFLMGSMWKIISITVLYWLFIKKLGPAYMKHRPPYELKNVLLIYNLLQVVTNLWLAFIATRQLISNDAYADWSCMRPDRSTTPIGLNSIRQVHFYYVLKVIDYADTIFFVLRKRYNQITFLHVYHHIMMVLGCYLGVRYVGGGHAFMLGYINAYVHAVMYFYYFMSALRPAMKNSLWWKKYITQMQITQFLLLIVHFSRALFNKNCDQPKLFMGFCVLQNAFMALMFGDFYFKAYIKKPKAKKEDLKK